MGQLSVSFIQRTHKEYIQERNGDFSTLWPGRGLPEALGELQEGSNLGNIETFVSYQIN
jgi:hypothetical protein